MNLIYDGYTPLLNTSSTLYTSSPTAAPTTSKSGKSTKSRRTRVRRNRNRNRQLASCGKSKGSATTSCEDDDSTTDSVTTIVLPSVGSSVVVV